MESDPQDIVEVYSLLAVPCEALLIRMGTPLASLAIVPKSEEMQQARNLTPCHG